MLVDVPIKNQRTEVGRDKRPPEDGNYDCVPTSLAAMAQALTSMKWAGDDLHDEVWSRVHRHARPQPLRRGAAGLRRAPDPLLTRTIAELDHGHPVLLSIPSDWNDTPPHSGFAHMVAACDVVHEAASASRQELAERLHGLRDVTASFYDREVGGRGSVPVPSTLKAMNLRTGRDPWLLLEQDVIGLLTVERRIEIDQIN